MTLHSVLYVDDDPDVRAVAALALQRDGELRVTTCGSGAEAIELARRAPPDLIILDYLMPELDGADTLVRLRVQHETQDVPVIFVTTIGICDDITRFAAMGLLGIIEKPFGLSKLLGQVRELWRRRGGAAQSA